MDCQIKCDYIQDILIMTFLAIKIKSCIFDCVKFEAGKNKCLGPYTAFIQSVTKVNAYLR